MRLRGRSGGRLELFITSAYFPGDSEGSPPPTEMEAPIQHCQEIRLPLTAVYFPVFRELELTESWKAGTKGEKRPIEFRSQDR